MTKRKRRKFPSTTTENGDEKTAVSQTVSGEEGGLNGWLDRHFPDERMKRIYPNAKFVD